MNTLKYCIPVELAQEIDPNDDGEHYPDLGKLTLDQTVEKPPTTPIVHEDWDPQP